MTKRETATPVYRELRELTRVYMANHGLTQAEMGARIGVSQRALGKFAFEPEESAAVLNPESLETLVELLRADGLCVKRLRTGVALETARRVARRKTTGFGRPLAAVRSLKRE